MGLSLRAVAVSALEKARVDMSRRETFTVRCPPVVTWRPAIPPPLVPMHEAAVDPVAISTRQGYPNIRLCRQTSPAGRRRPRTRPASPSRTRCCCRRSTLARPRHRLGAHGASMPEEAPRENECDARHAERNVGFERTPPGELLRQSVDRRLVVSCSCTPHRSVTIPWLLRITWRSSRRSRPSSIRIASRPATRRPVRAGPGRQPRQRAAASIGTLPDP